MGIMGIPSKTNTNTNIILIIIIMGIMETPFKD